MVVITRNWLNIEASTCKQVSKKRKDFSDERLVIISRRKSMLEVESNNANLSDNMNPPSSIAGTCPKGLMAAILHNQKFRSCYHLSN
jgi:ABC-type molybdate transport system substrate-binding protein